MAEENKIIRLADVGELEADLKKDLAEEETKGKTADILYCESISDELSDLGNLPTIDPKTLRPVAHWEEIPGSYEVCAGESGSWSVPATRCANQEEQDRACEILSKIGTDDDLRDAIFTSPAAIAAKLKAYCESKDQNCGGCAFDKSGRCALRNPPPEWEIEEVQPNG